MKKTIYIGFLFALVLVSCAPGSSVTLPPGLTLVPGTDIPQQVATFVSGALTQTALAPIPATVTPIPGTSMPDVTIPLVDIPSSVLQSYQTLYQSSSLGIQFSYPSAWYRQDINSGMTLTSFDPSNPPHKLEWTYETTNLQFGSKVFITPPGSFDNWVESERQAAYSNQLTISEEERFSIAAQPAHRLSLVSGSGGVINKILTEINGRYLEINVEGNYNNNLARTVLNSIQPFISSGLKPADSDTPASGICGEVLGDPVNITLGLDPSGLPLAGRCIVVASSQRIRLINQTNGPFAINFADYTINLPAGEALLLDQTTGQYLALGVHFMPMAPELWVKDSSPPPTVPPQHVIYDVTMADNGRAFYMKIGDELRIYLDEAYIWSMASISDPAVLGGAQAGYFAFANGIATLTMTGSPECLNSTPPCGIPSIVFTITAIVQNDSPPTPAFTPIPTTTQPQHAVYDATMADNGKTFVMNIGDKIRINLDYSYGWSTISDFNPSILMGAADGYFAIASGTTTLTLNGNPECLNTTPPCGMPSILFTITVIVK